MLNCDEWSLRLNMLPTIVTDLMCNRCPRLLEAGVRRGAASRPCRSPAFAVGEVVGRIIERGLEKGACVEFLPRIYRDPSLGLTMKNDSCRMRHKQES